MSRMPSYGIAACLVIMAVTTMSMGGWGVTTALPPSAPSISAGAVPRDPGDVGTLGDNRDCSGEDLTEKTCADPGDCLNACAYHCPGLTKCYQCCLHFAEDPAEYRKCRQYCDDVFNPGPIGP